MFQWSAKLLVRLFVPKNLNPHILNMLEDNFLLAVSSEFKENHHLHKN